METLDFANRVLSRQEIFSFFQEVGAEESEMLLEAMLSSCIGFVRAYFAQIPTAAFLKETLKDLLNKGKGYASLYLIQEKLDQLKKEVYLLEKQSEFILTGNEEKSLKRIKSKSVPLFLKPSSDWRKGDNAMFMKSSTENCQKKLNHKDKLAIYPQWWLNLMQKIPERREKDPSSRTKSHTQNSLTKPQPNHSKTHEFKLSSISSLIKTCEKSVEANIESYQSNSSENRVRFDEKNIETSRNSVKDSVYAELYNKEQSNSSSSTSNYFPTAEMKKFYQEEFKRLFGNAFK